MTMLNLKNINLRTIFYLVILQTVFLSTGCNRHANTSIDKSPTLIIQSGFEPNTSMYKYSDDILGFQGVDQSVLPPNDWTLANADPNIGDFYCQLGAPGTLVDRNAFITTDLINPLNHVLAFQIKNATEPDPLKGRVSMNIMENNGLQEIYYKVKLFLPIEFGSLKDYNFTPGNWLTLMEFWHKPDWTTPAPFPFRITLYVINSPDKKNLNFAVEAQSMDPNNWQSIWKIPNTIFNLPFNEWMQMEVYYKDGDKSTGRFYMAVTRSNGDKTVLFDVTNITHHPQNPTLSGLYGINPMKLYCSKAVVDWVTSHQLSNETFQIYWDDFEFWKNKNPFQSLK